MNELIELFNNRRAIVGVIGLGYVGLPLASTIAEAGFATVGFDTKTRKIEALRRHQSYIRHVPATRLAQLVRSEPLAAGKAGLYPSADFADLARCDGILICVPTPLTENREPDLSYVVDTSEAVAQHLRRGQLVVLESTTYPGTTDEVVRPILERGGLRVGPRLPSGVLAGARGSEQQQLQHADHSQAGRRHHTRVRPRRRGAVRHGDRPGRARLQRQRRRGRQAARERLPQRQHRPGQRAQGAVRSHGAQRLGDHRRRGDQTVRLHARSSPAPAWAVTVSPSTRST